MNKQFDWKKKRELIKKIHDAETIKVISIDVFDTLLLRAVDNPREVFEYMYEISPGSFPKHINKEDWRELRTRVEAVAKKKIIDEQGDGELTLGEIYSHIPSKLFDSKVLMDLEIECEKELCYLNPEIIDFIIDIYSEKKYKIVLTSDMYLGKDIIQNILVDKGLNINFVDAIYVSSEYGASKKRKNLFTIMMDDQSVNPCEVIHIGDSLDNDIKPSIELGMNCYYYDVISSASMRFPYFTMENLKYGTICSGISSLRKISADINPYEGETAEWFDIGSMILGPVFTGFAEWVLNTAEDEDINQIFPIMREGEFLTKLLINAEEYRENKKRIEPIFTSRKVLYSSIKNILEKRDANIIVHSDLITVSSAMKLLNIKSECPETVRDYMDIPINSLMRENKGIYTIFKEWVLSEEILSEIHYNNENSDELLVDYLKNMGFEAPYITLDIGWRGSVPDGIQRILENREIFSRSVNLLMFGRSDSLPNIIDNCDIRGYIGNFGKDAKLIREIFVRAFECFVISSVGTTVGYERKGDKIVPVLNEIAYKNMDQFEKIRICEEGILSFQKLYLGLNNETIRRVETVPQDLCRLMARLFMHPLFRESELIGKLSFDQNLGVNITREIIDVDVQKKFNKLEIDDFLAGNNTREVEWFSAMETIKNPFYHFEIACRDKCFYSEIKVIEYIKRILKKETGKFVIVGAGGTGRKILRYFKVAGIAERIESFADNNTNLHNINLDGKPVRAFTYDFTSDVFIVGTIDRNIQEDIVKDLLALRGESVKYYAYYR